MKYLHRTATVLAALLAITSKTPGLAATPAHAEFVISNHTVSWKAAIGLNDLSREAQNVRQ